MASPIKPIVEATCTGLGRFHKGKYVIDSECIETVKDLIRLLKRDNESHEVRRHLGHTKILQNDLMHIIKNCRESKHELFDMTIRLIANLTLPTIIFFGEEVPSEKSKRNTYLHLMDHVLEYKKALCDIQFWNKVCGKLRSLFAIDCTERSAEQEGAQIERILILIRNVLRIPPDLDKEKEQDNCTTVHDKLLCVLRQSQILELLVFGASNNNEMQYYLNFLEIFSLVLGDHNPKSLAQCDIDHLTQETHKRTKELIRVRDMEKRSKNRYTNVRNFNSTFVVKGVKTFANNDRVYHKRLEKVNDFDPCMNNGRMRVRKDKIPVQSERFERQSTFSNRLFLKEFSLEFLNSGYSHLMRVVKNRLESGKSLIQDRSHYFWALYFFLEFAIASDVDVNLVEDSLQLESFLFVLSTFSHAFQHLVSNPKESAHWVKRIHLVLKAYHALLKSMVWLDSSCSILDRAFSRELKSQVFYMTQFREMTQDLLNLYVPEKFSISYLRDLVETNHLFVKLLEEYCKRKTLYVQKVMRKKAAKEKKEKEEQEMSGTEEEVETKSEKWEKIKDNIYDLLCCNYCKAVTFPEIPPFDAALDIPIDDQKGRSIKKIQKFLHEGCLKEAIGLLRSSRQVWPENNYFGVDRMQPEDERNVLREICLAELEHLEGDDERSGENEKISGKKDEISRKDDEKLVSGGEDIEDLFFKETVNVNEENFDIMVYKKQFANKKVVEVCAVLLKNYKKNSDHTNHCAIKLLHRIGWECCMPAMLYQASLFLTLLTIMNDKSKDFHEINTFSVNLLQRFRKHAVKSPMVFLELLFWKESKVALQIQHGYEPYEDKKKPSKRSKVLGNINENADDENIEEKVGGRKRGRKKGSRKAKVEKTYEQISRECLKEVLRINLSDASTDCGLLSDPSPEKRNREEGKERSDCLDKILGDEEYNVKISKRGGFIGSDSDMQNVGTDKEKVMSGRTKRRMVIDSDSDVQNGGSDKEEVMRVRTKRRMVIDSDSDVEVNYSLNDNDIKNK